MQQNQVPQQNVVTGYYQNGQQVDPGIQAQFVAPPQQPPVQPPVYQTQQVYANPNYVPAQATMNAMQQTAKQVYNGVPDNGGGTPTADTLKHQVIDESIKKIKELVDMGIFGFGSNNNPQMSPQFMATLTPQQQAMLAQQQQQSFWNTPTGDVAKVGIGGAIMFGAMKMFNFFGGRNVSSYNPDPQELNEVGEAIKTIFK